MRVLYVGEIVGKAGVFTVKKLLAKVKKDFAIDFTIGNADSATGGAGLGRQHAVYLRKLGIEAVTLGECCYYKKDIVEQLGKSPWLVRPANYPYGNPGRGYKVFMTPKGPLALVCLLGQAGFPRVHLANPFQSAQDLGRKLRDEAKVLVLDFHAAMTAEKETMARHLDGLYSAVIGSHGKTLTADARLLPGGTAAITDAGRTGSLQSVGGLDPATRIKEYLTGIPVWAKDGTTGLELQGCVIEFRPDGRAASIEALRIPCEEVLDDRTGNGDGDQGTAADRPA